MALLRKKSKVQDEIPTSSMADIAFLLLIFFLVTTIFDQDQGLQVMLPERDQDETEVPPDNLLFLLVQPGGAVEVRRGESPQTQSITFRQVEGVVRAAMQSNPNIIAAIQTHPDARYVDMTNVLDGVRSAGLGRFALQQLDQ